jgi:hypothetical protein
MQLSNQYSCPSRNQPLTPDVVSDEPASTLVAGGLRIRGMDQKSHLTGCPTQSLSAVRRLSAGVQLRV